ncbi:MAG: type VI secretion system baseplate subunit TssF, partial [Planctomycetaceae bacterium]|nr:type VI secretion system baseplate subunit TssF [Planctomycetaceae bacterium]
PHGDEVDLAPFYSFDHDRTRTQEAAFWHAARRPAESRGDALDPGTEVFLSLLRLDDAGQSAIDPLRLLVQTTCLNRDRPAALPFGGGEPRLQFVDGEAGDVRVRCLTRPTPTRRPALGYGTRWRVISHLSLNGLSLQDANGAEGLREILRLYEHFDPDRERHASRLAAEQIEGLQGVTFQRTTGRREEIIRGRRHQFVCRGVMAELQFDESKFSGGGLYLLASVLDRFLGLYCSINSFVQTRAVTSSGKVYQWPQRAGDQVLL